MPLDIDTIAKRVDNLKQRHAERDIRMEQIQAVRKGNMADVFPELFPELFPEYCWPLFPEYCWPLFPELFEYDGAYWLLKAIFIDIIEMVDNNANLLYMAESFIN